jgi:hypothetical protein
MTHIVDKRSDFVFYGDTSSQRSCHCTLVRKCASSVYVDVGKILPFERGSGCKISCMGGESWLASSSFVGTSIWKDMVQRILFDMGLRTVLIIGKKRYGEIHICSLSYK